MRIARTEQIRRMYFPSKQTCCRRLRILHGAGLLHREALPGCGGYFWAAEHIRYTLKTLHDLAITEVYVTHRPLEWRMDVVVGGMKPDAAMRTREGTFIVEVDCGTTSRGILSRKLRHYERVLSQVDDAPKILVVSA